MKTRKNFTKTILIILVALLRLNLTFGQIGKEDLPDMDAQAFKTYMDGKLSGTVKGYAFYLTKDGNYVTSGAGGVARTSEDNDGKVLPYTLTTIQEIASVSKTITAVALLRAMEKNNAVNINSKIGPYLPKAWKPSPSFYAITFKQLLAHRAGLREDTLIGGVGDESNIEKYSMKNISPDTQLVRKYFNLNYQILRVAIPYILYPAMHTDDLVLLDQLNKGNIDKETYNDKIQEKISGRYRALVLNELFLPAGITSATCNSVGLLNTAYAYANNSSVNGGYPSKDYNMYCSSGYWQASAKDVALFMTKVMNTQDIISNTSKALINNTTESDPSLVGWSYKVKRNDGYYYGHGGDIYIGNKPNQRAVHSYLMYFPHGYVGYVHVNSNELGSWELKPLLIEAYDAGRKLPYNCYSSGGTYTFPQSSFAGHISRVILGSLDNKSLKSTGYSYFNQITTSLKKDSTYTLTLKSDFTSIASIVYWSVWIDYNQDDIFQANEKVFAKSSKSGLQEQIKITIPTSAQLGITRMRVALKRHDSEVIADACDDFQFGEVEDYNLNITKPCGILNNLLAVNLTSTGATLRFDKPVDNISYYVLRYQQIGTAEWTITNPEPNTPFSYVTQNVANLKPNTTYRWHVRSDCGDFTTYHTFTTGDVTICGTDLYEANPNSYNAKPINLGETKSGLICSNTATNDEDWFKFNVSSNIGTKIKIDLTSLPADYDLFLYKNDLSLIATSEKIGTASEAIEKSLTTGLYYIKIIGYAGAEHTHNYYQLSVKNGDAITSNAALREMASEEESPVLAQEVIVSPNPVTNGTFNITFNSKLSEKTKPQIIMSKATGSKVAINYTYDEGMITVQTGDLEKGIYILKIVLDNKVNNSRVMVK